jgi:hypothetical protein
VPAGALCEAKHVIKESKVISRKRDSASIKVKEVVVSVEKKKVVEVSSSIEMEGSFESSSSESSGSESEEEAGGIVQCDDDASDSERSLMVAGSPRPQLAFVGRK